MRPYRHQIATLGVVALVVALSGCDKLKKSVADLKSQQKAAAKTPSADPAIPTVPYRNDQVTAVSPANFHAFTTRADGLMIVDFNAKWCGPCKMLGPILEKAAKNHPGVVYIGKVDVDSEPQLAQQHGVSCIPDVRIYKDGREVERFVGYPGEAQVMAKIEGHAKGIVPKSTEAAANPVAKTTGGTPAAATPATAAKGEIKPFQKDWLPPGMSRRTAAQPEANHPAAAARER